MLILLLDSISRWKNVKGAHLISRVEEELLHCAKSPNHQIKATSAEFCLKSGANRSDTPGCLYVCLSCITSLLKLANAGAGWVTSHTYHVMTCWFCDVKCLAYTSQRQFIKQFVHSIEHLNHPKFEFTFDGFE